MCFCSLSIGSRVGKSWYLQRKRSCLGAASSDLSTCMSAGLERPTRLTLTAAEAHALYQQSGWALKQHEEELHLVLQGEEHEEGSSDDFERRF